MKKDEREYVQYCRLIAVALAVAVLLPIPSSAGQRLASDDFIYLGAFRLPDEFSWGARGMSYYPGGAEGSGSLLITASEALRTPSGEACYEGLTGCAAYFGEVAIPVPQKEADWTALPAATILTGPAVFDGVLAATISEANAFVSGIQYVPRQGTQSGDKIYGSINEWYPEGDYGDDSFATVWFADMDGSGAQGMFHVGTSGGRFFHGRKMGDFLFDVPAWYAEDYLDGRTIVTGR